MYLYKLGQEHQFRTVFGMRGKLENDMFQQRNISSEMGPPGRPDLVKIPFSIFIWLCTLKSWNNNKNNLLTSHLLARYSTGFQIIRSRPVNYI